MCSNTKASLEQPFLAPNTALLFSKTEKGYISFRLSAFINQHIKRQHRNTHESSLKGTVLDVLQPDDLRPPMINSLEPVTMSVSLPLYPPPPLRPSIQAQAVRRPHLPQRRAALLEWGTARHPPLWWMENIKVSGDRCRWRLKGQATRSERMDVGKEEKRGRKQVERETVSGEWVNTRPWGVEHLNEWRGWWWREVEKEEGRKREGWTAVQDRQMMREIWGCCYVALCCECFPLWVNATIY